MRRAWKNISREPRAVQAAMGQAIILGLIVGFLFFRLGHDQVYNLCPCANFAQPCAFFFWSWAQCRMACAIATVYSSSSPSIRHSLSSPLALLSSTKRRYCNARKVAALHDRASCHGSVVLVHIVSHPISWGKQLLKHPLSSCFPRSTVRSALNRISPSVIIVYWLTGLRPEAAPFFIFLLIFNFLILAAHSFGLVISAVTPTFEV